jgi:hypothetical protein
MPSARWGIGNQRGGVQLQGIKLRYVQQQKLNIRMGKAALLSPS